MPASLTRCRADVGRSAVVRHVRDRSAARRHQSVPVVTVQPMTTAATEPQDDAQDVDAEPPLTTDERLRIAATYAVAVQLLSGR